MSTQPATDKPPRRRRRKAASTAQPAPQTQARVTPCGRKSDSTAAFFAIRFECGAMLWLSYSALSRSACPDCLVDRLHDTGYLQYGDPIIANFTLSGDMRHGPYGRFSGIELAGHLAGLSAPDALHIQIHEIHPEEC